VPAISLDASAANLDHRVSFIHKAVNFCFFALKEFYMTDTSIVTKIVSLMAEQDSVLFIKQGRVWATVGTGGDDVDDNYGDHFLEAGQTLSVSKGQNLVFESMNAGVPMFFDFTAI
jgi:hypothetical protein